ncbi:MAG: bifunctional diguanylate cyclase/phosphohydrolase [Bacillota bacterium]
MERWKKSYYVLEKPVGNKIPWTLIVEEPVAPFQNYLYRLYIKSLAIMVILAVLALLMAEFVSSKMVIPLSKLAKITTNLPHKLLDQQTVDWPRKSVQEIDVLAGNFKHMAGTLKQSFCNINRANETLKHLAFYDPLTGLYNRAYFEEEMCRLDGTRNTPVSIIVCDVDGLKLVNDTLGHDSGDSLLIAAAGVIKESFREGDAIARIGGDEFAVLLPNSDEAAAEKACHRIRDAVARYNSTNPELAISMSIGSATSKSADNLNETFKEADNNMYREKLHRIQSARSAMVQILMKALGARDFITEGHADRLQELVAGLARSAGLPERTITDLRLLARFHDIGKVGIPDRILFKTSPLTREEFKEMQQHCEIGYRIAQAAPDLIPIADWIYKHHEWWNGQGYPLGLKGEEIPVECRILAIADAYDAMTSERPYRKAMPHEEAVAEIKKCSGTQFDPHLVDTLVKMLESRNRQGS